MTISIRIRMTILVACAFAAVLLVSSSLFLQWFEGQLIDEVRDDDRIELDRQVEIIGALSTAAQAIPGLITEQDLVTPMTDDGFPVAIVPDDGTIISISNADGVLLTDSHDSFRQLTNPTVSAETDEPLPLSDMSEEQVLEAIDNAPRFLEVLTTELSSETLAEYAITVELLEGVFSHDAEAGAEFEASAQLSERLNELFFGFDERTVEGTGRVITTSLETTILGAPVTITATSRVASIDAALDDVTRTVWIAGPVLVALAAAMTYLATGRALRPVDSLSRQVEAITSARSGDRVPEPRTGDEINQLAVTMNGMLDRLEDSAQTQRRFVSDVSHELRTPAAVIRAEIETGLAEAENDWQETARSVLAEQERLSKLVDDLLLLSRMDEGGPVHRIDIDLDALVQEEARRGWVHPVGVRAVEPVRIRGEERQVARLIQNLVANANRHARSSVELTLRADGDEAVLWVDDDGTGVPASERERVFERFARLDASRERDLGGSGLGLAIVRQVAEAHGGTATITNSPLGGARAEVRLVRHH